MQPSEEIKQKLDIVDVIREYIQLKPAGMNFRANCPFHREKTPSFMVSPDKQIWHCFGCSKGGDIFSFVQEVEGIEFVEALRLLAPKAGVVLKRQDPKMQSRRNKILDVLDLSRRYYHKVLIDSPAAEYAREYLDTRGLSEETIDEWQIGYSPDSWDTTLKFLKERGYREDDISAAGQALKSDNSSRYYDRFRGRIMFPIMDVNANTVAFSARMDPRKEETDKMGKYINSPQTDVYDKSKILFGLDKAKMEIKRRDLAIIVEGQMDAISAHQAGWKNVIASSGTALTADQIKLIKRYTSNIALAFDMDEAGAMAADRGIRSALTEEMLIKVITLPSGKDPDECIRHNPKEWEAAVNSAQPMMEYFINKSTAGLDLASVDNRRRVARETLPIISQIMNRIEQDHWLSVLSDKIGVKDSILRETLNAGKKPPGKTPDKPEEAKTDAPAGGGSREERMGELLLALVFREPSVFDYVVNNIQIEYFVGPDLSSLYKKLLFYYNNTIKQTQDQATESPEHELNYNDFREWLSNETTNNSEVETKNQFKLLERLVFLADQEFSDYNADNIKGEVIEIILNLKKANLQNKMKKLGRELAQSEAAGEKEKSQSLLEEIKMITDELNSLNN